ncbi:MAG: hypothetical protein A4E53_01642 [Pelotomaculum sp. PtaB.Bin104]|jgi:hypothetical protein|nr:MAG: hypothetical protein A4E53_01642 [Pelotomaculum sp. PtaB.Bin104]
MSRYNRCPKCVHCDGKTCEADGEPIDEQQDTSECLHFEEKEEADA